MKTETKWCPTFRDSRAAFADAIAAGVLSDATHTENFAGNYMYMHTDAGTDAFKHIDTRRYVWNPPRDE